MFELDHELCERSRLQDDHQRVAHGQPRPAQPVHRHAQVSQSSQCIFMHRSVSPGGFVMHRPDQPVYRHTHVSQS